MATFNDLLTNTQATIEALAFVWGGQSQTVDVEVASQPLNREAIEPALPTIFVTPSVRPEEVQQGCSGGFVDVTYRLDISIIAPGNASFETNLPIYLGWRESMRKALQRVNYSSIPGFWGVRLTPREVLNRELQRDNYDFSVLEVEYLVLEKATN